MFLHFLKPDVVDRADNQPADNDCNGGRDVIPADNPDVEVGGVIEQQIEQRFLAGHGKRPLDETPSGAAKPSKDEDRIAPFHGVFLRRVSARLGVVFGVLAEAFPQG